MRIDLKLEKPEGKVAAVGSGFIALDVIEAEQGEHFATGGTCGNVLRILAWLGWQSYPVARLGTDAAGDFILDELAGVGVDITYIRQDGSTPTPIVFQRNVLDRNGRRTHRFAMTCPGCGQWLPRFRPIVRADAERTKAGMTAKPAAFFFDRVSPGILSLARWAREEGAVVMFEPSSFSDDKAFRTAIELCHILKFSKERLGHVKDFGNAAFPAIVIETQGEQGLRIRWHDKWTNFDAFDAPRFVDAAGAGDWCSAGFLHMVSQRGAAGLDAASKKMIERAVRLGQALSALNCGYEGATGLMENLSVASASKLLRTLLGGKGELPEIGDAETRSTRKIPLCSSCKPEKQPSRQVLSKRDARAR